MSLELQLAQVEREIAQADRVIELSDVLKRLESNRDFKKIVTELYFKEEAVRLVHLKADPAMQADKMQANIDRDITAIGVFAGFLREIHKNGDRARMSKADDVETRDELAAKVMGATNG